MNDIKVSAFRWVPPFAQGLVRDLRVRWALEEAGLDYEPRLLGREDQKSSAYLALQPFGQVPAFEADGLALFESGAIVLHIAENSEALMPVAPGARARVKTWMFASLNTVEPPIMMLSVIDMRGGDAEGVKDLRTAVLGAIKTRLDTLADFLGGRQYLIDDRFTAADLLMVTVLRMLRTTDLVEQNPALTAYVRRGEQRPAFKKALADQLAAFAENEPKSA